MVPKTKSRQRTTRLAAFCIARKATQMPETATFEPFKPRGGISIETLNVPTIRVEEIREAITGGILDAILALGQAVARDPEAVSLRPDERAALAEYNARQAEFRRAAQRKVFEVVNDANL